jgi:hypothetical protein
VRAFTNMGAHVALTLFAHCATLVAPGRHLRKLKTCFQVAMSELQCKLTVMSSNAARHRPSYSSHQGCTRAAAPMDVPSCSRRRAHSSDSQSRGPGCLRGIARKHTFIETVSRARDHTLRIGFRLALSLLPRLLTGYCPCMFGDNA